jgi:hypothetical protein
VANSGLIVFLPLVSAFVGAIIGAYANSWYRNREAEKARDEEREGLLILLSIEVAGYNRLFETFLERRVSMSDIDDRAGVATVLQSTVWDESKVRLAQLQMPGTYLETVAHYYARIDAQRQFWTVPPGDLSEDDSELVREIREEGINVIQVTKDYVSDPEFAARMLSASKPP